MRAQDLWHQSAAAFTDVYEHLMPDRDGLPTPCTEWSARQLADHAIGVQAWLGGLLGADIADPSWNSVRVAFASYLDAGGDLEGAVDLPNVGAMPRSGVVDICTFDLLIHTWDLARSLGVAEELPPAVVEACYAWLRSLPEAMLRTGRYAAETPTTPEMDTQAKMLAFAGRQP